MKKFVSIMSVLIACLCIVMSILFCFELKGWGFSQIELAIFFLVLVVLNYAFTGIVIKYQGTTSTLFLVTVVMLLIIILQVLGVSLLADAIRTFFVL